MEHVSEEQIILWCLAEDRELIGDPSTANKIVKVQDVVIKFGDLGVEESRNQEHAHSLLDGDRFRVPRVRNFFQKDGVGYLTMDYIDGRAFSCGDEEDLQKVVVFLAELHRSNAGIPGPVGGGQSRGLLWPQGEPPTFASIAEMEKFINDNLSVPQLRCSMPERLTFCHLDVAPRNLLVTTDGKLGILDWASAGFYPRPFEVAALRRNNKALEGQNRFEERLECCIRAADPFTQNEEKQLEAMLQMGYGHLRYGRSVILPARRRTLTRS
ncbi:hypothetical protein LTR86_011252 [Recurvomyces mirabilis]|nr:hypothetical protein LTR86_011252 [Recurvomyces mirabilis]